MGAAVFVVLALIVGIVGFSGGFAGDDEPTGAALPAGTPSAPSSASPSGSAGATATATPSGSAAAGSWTSPTPSAGSSSSASPPAAAGAAATPTTPATPTASATPSRPTPTPTPTKKPASAAPTPAPGLVLTATGTCWYRIRGDGKILGEGTLRKGQVRRYDGAREYDIILGNAGGVRYSVAGSAPRYRGDFGTPLRFTVVDRRQPAAG
ncbi:DUF4115 domain-containing protein [Motilibacter deserti]|uniref:DUF4115 domain-containing protein n=1 Tax=Motilibacter deserti TaxID=2714956 RepID=A0ABX0GQM4_9ACTN|nr:DUF4115 domain-containing protein [Motilibacter deserti]NHC12426.1 DUF4115 domain-containing protein [Motilibacter deserti]